MYSNMASLSIPSPSIGGRAARRHRPSVVCSAAVEEVLQQGTVKFTPEVPPGLNKYSSRITQPKYQGASQAMLYATGLDENSIDKPQVRLSFLFL